MGARFWRLFGAMGVSSVGDGMLLAGFPLLALTLTHNPLLISGVAIAGRLPALLFALPAGALADRVDRRRMLVILNVASAVSLGAFAGAVYAGWDSIGLLYAAIFVLGAADTAFSITAQASLPTLVPPGELPAANGYLLGIDVVGEQSGGPALGGVLASASLALPFVGDAVSFVASIGLLRKAVPGRAPVARQTSVVADLVTGLRWYLGDRFLRLLTLFVGCLAFCQSMVLALLVLYGTHELHLSRGGYGLFLGVVAVGQIAGFFASGRALARFGATRCIVGAGVIAALSYVVLSGSRSLFVAGVALLVEGLVVSIGSSVASSVRQLVVPADRRGRGGSVFRMIALGFVPLGGLAGGTVGALAGVRAAFLAAGLLQLVLVAILAVPFARVLATAWKGDHPRWAKA